MDFELCSEIFDNAELLDAKQRLQNGHVSLKGRAAKNLLGTGVHESTLNKLAEEERHIAMPQIFPEKFEAEHEINIVDGDRNPPGSIYTTQQTTFIVV